MSKPNAELAAAVNANAFEVVRRAFGKSHRKPFYNIQDMPFKPRYALRMHNRFGELVRLNPTLLK